MAAYSIKTIFWNHWKSVKQILSRRYEPSHWESIVSAVEKMLSCRDPSIGYKEYMCTKCGETKKVSFTCKSRFCTSCGKKYVDEWVNKTVDKIINVAHRHIVFTIPEELRRSVFNMLFLIRVMSDCASKTALEVLQSQGSEAIPGILAVVHTFGGDLKFNPHVHLLMTEGGLTNGNAWKDIPFLPYNLLRKKWQYHLLTEVKKHLPKTREHAKFIDRLFKKNPKGFYVNGESKMTSARYTSRYIGRYLARPALAEYRISRYDGNQVKFWYESHETGKREYRTLNVVDFISRLITHIPLKGFKMVRRYGLYSRRSKGIPLETLKGCRRFVQMTLDFFKDLPKKLSWRQRLIASFGKDPLICPHCKQEMELWSIWHPDYGYIYDFCRDSSAVEPEFEKNLQKAEDKERIENSRKAVQLSLFDALNFDGRLIIQPCF